MGTGSGGGADPTGGENTEPEAVAAAPDAHLGP